VNTPRVTTSDSPVPPALRVVRGDPSAEELAALVTVVQAIAAASSAEPPARPRSEWSAAHRRMRTSFPSGPGAWRSSGLPR
jgi:hypothetical protein